MLENIKTIIDRIKQNKELSTLKDRIWDKTKSILNDEQDNDTETDDLINNK